MESHLSMRLSERTSLRLPPSVLVFVVVLLIDTGTALGQATAVDFRYAPENYWTVICFPDDWQKTLVSERGALCYDYGPGPYARPLTEVSFGLAGKTVTRARQYLEDPRIPVISTVLSTDSSEIHLTTFAVAVRPGPPAVRQPAEGATWSNGRIRRLGGLNGCIAWAVPPDTVDPIFRNTAWGTNRPILYRVKIEPGGERRVALGLCESYKPLPGRRVQELRVEGAPPASVDPMASGKKNVPVVILFDARDENADGWLAIEAHSAGPDGNVVLNAFWVFPAGTNITADEIIGAKWRSRAEIFHSCGTELERTAPSPRVDAIVADLSPNSQRPQVTIRTRRQLTVGSPLPGAMSVVLSSGTDPYLLSSPLPLRTIPTPEGWLLEYQPGTQKVCVAVVHGNQGPSRVLELPSPAVELAATRLFWTQWFRARKGQVTVPDPTIQMLFDASLRTMYQVRENVDGLRQFQPGPSVYRGLWIGDVILTGVPVTLLGDTASMREFLETGFRHQQPGGQVRILYPFESYLETIGWVFASLWYARTTNDGPWLAGHWTALASGLEWICSLRQRSFSTPDEAYAGLVPPGFVDGGIITPMADYGTVWWAMIALDEGIRAAARLGAHEQSTRWKRTLQGFEESFRNAARRDIRRDWLGNRFLPVGVGDTSTAFPQKGQYALVIPVRHGGQLFVPGSLADSVIRMNLRMFDAYLRQGLLVNSGWLLNGVWPWLGGTIGIAHQQLGNGKRAVEFLHAYAQHASPTGVWVEEQLVEESGTTTAGDVSDAEASAVFVHLVRHLLLTERGSDLELFGGLPPGWIRPGTATTLRNVMSEFGEFSAELRISADGKRAHIRVSAIDGQGSPGRPYVALRALREMGFVTADGKPAPEYLPWPWQSELVLELHR